MSIGGSQGEIEAELICFVCAVAQAARDALAIGGFLEEHDKKVKSKTGGTNSKKR